VLLRLRGLVADRQGDEAAARCYLEEAILRAREQGARLFELLAARQLASFLMRAGDRATARRVLVEACDGLEGGTSIACVTEAREFLSTLA
jgi:hypothetical protein